MKNLALFVSLATAALGAVPHAQDGPQARRVTQPLRNASLDLSTGVITRGPAIRAKSAPSFNTCSSLNNLDHSGWVGVDSGIGPPNSPCEWVNAATKSAGKSGYMSSFEFAYCSSALDPSSGGTGGKTRIGFRSGYLNDSSLAILPHLGTQAALFNLSGLPAWTSCSSFFGGFNCFQLGVDYGTAPVVLPDGPIAWSWQFRDLGTDGLLAKTFPFLGCVTSCTPFGNLPDGVDMDDTVDRYCPAGSPSFFAFSFGTSTFGARFTSISMDIVEVEATSASSSSVSGGNPSILAAGPLPTLGLPWSVTLDCSGADPSKLAVFRVGFGPSPAPAVTKWGTVLCPLAAGTGINVVVPHGGGNAQLGPFLLPYDLAFYGACFCVQGLCGDAPVGYLSNALVQVIG